MICVHRQILYRMVVVSLPSEGGSRVLRRIESQSGRSSSREGRRCQHITGLILEHWAFVGPVSNKWSYRRGGVIYFLGSIRQSSFPQISFWDLSWHGTYNSAIHNDQRVLNKTNNPGGKDENLPAATTDDEHKWEGFWATASIFQVSSARSVLYT